MGYLTEHIITIESRHTQEDLQALKQKLESIIDCKFDIEPGLLKSGAIKWYSCKKDVTKISEEYPDWLILVEAEGEDQGDVWKLYCKGGKVVRLDPVITFPEFKESMLK